MRKKIFITAFLFTVFSLFLLPLTFLTPNAHAAVINSVSRYQRNDANSSGCRRSCGGGLLQRMQGRGAEQGSDSGGRCGFFRGGRGGESEGGARIQFQPGQPVRNALRAVAKGIGRLLGLGGRRRGGGGGGGEGGGGDFNDDQPSGEFNMDSQATASGENLGELGMSSAQAATLIPQPPNTGNQPSRPAGLRGLEPEQAETVVAGVRIPPASGESEQRLRAAAQTFGNTLLEEKRRTGTWNCNPRNVPGFPGYNAEGRLWDRQNRERIAVSDGTQERTFVYDRGRNQWIPDPTAVARRPAALSDPNQIERGRLLPIAEMQNVRRAPGNTNYHFGEYRGQMYLGKVQGTSFKIIGHIPLRLNED